LLAYSVKIISLDSSTQGNPEDIRQFVNSG
jgi:hypothetical protein